MCFFSFFPRVDPSKVLLRAYLLKTNTRTSVEPSTNLLYRHLIYRRTFEHYRIRSPDRRSIWGVAKYQTGLSFHIFDKMLRQFSAISAISLLLGALPGRALAAQILTTSGFSTCLTNSDITVQKLDITYDNDAKTVTFDVAGSSAKVMNVTAVLNVTAYGTQVYQNSFNPCDPSTFVSQLCPGKFEFLRDFREGFCPSQTLADWVKQYQQVPSPRQAHKIFLPPTHL